MELPYWAQVCIFFFSALILLRLSGKKTLASMTVGEAIIMISLGTLMAAPLITDSLFLNIYGAAVIVGALILISYIKIHIPATRPWLEGQPIVLIKNGNVVEKNLRRAKLTENDLKQRLRMVKVNDISKVKTATLEISGNLGVEVSADEEPASQKDFQEIKRLLLEISRKLDVNPIGIIEEKPERNDLFAQVTAQKDRDPFE